MASDAVAGESAEPEPGVGTVGGAPVTRWTRRRVQRLASRVVLGLGCVLTAMCVALLVACFMDDRAVESLRGESVAEVLDRSPTRTVVRFNDDQGRVHIPPNGVLYPAGLQKGQMVRVEYDGRNPDLARVAGRTVSVALLPVASALVGLWVVVAPAFLLLRRASRGHGPPPAEHG